MEKKTLVLGVSDNPSRFAYKAIRSLQRRDIPIVAIGRKDIDLDGIKIRKGQPAGVEGVHTVSLYMNSSHCSLKVLRFKKALNQLIVCNIWQCDFQLFSSLHFPPGGKDGFMVPGPASAGNPIINIPVKHHF